MERMYRRSQFRQNRTLPHCVSAVGEVQLQGPSFRGIHTKRREGKKKASLWHQVEAVEYLYCCRRLRPKRKLNPLLASVQFICQCPVGRGTSLPTANRAKAKREILSFFGKCLIHLPQAHSRWQHYLKFISSIDLHTPIRSRLITTINSNRATVYLTTQ
jgi:hypothetical protein